MARPKPSNALSVADVAEMLGFDAGTIARLLEREETRAELFPDAREVSGGWIIPASAVRRILGPNEPRLYGVAEFARLIGFSTGYVYAMIREGMIKTRLVFGQVRVPASEYYTLPAHRAEHRRAAAAPFFFSREVPQHER